MCAPMYGFSTIVHYCAGQPTINGEVHFIQAHLILL